ncbi:hypothetical protein BCR36DRAFT_403505 [Piromyces finnis]|uniref:ARID domain-containing protein n=1 Tax=Piromyces finnis TaxID=1754191 RepID=A0A1Y1VE19_9FUNG|nr:hypothetical protein BCR36DRAFT_403505 [Piromyces finnis]|eukprot:ORX53875.1 hypothetical protein BCR36DRAFT_403505 [Piromyces finnis]
MPVQLNIKKPVLPLQSLSGEEYEKELAEHDAFMKDLEQFHLERGSVLQKQPVLGGQRIDLHFVYKNVISQGGFDKVTADRSWRKISIPLNLPSTCTNSAFVMKNVYIKFLLAYEKVNYWGEKDASIIQHPPKKNEKSNSSSSKTSSPYIDNSVLKSNKMQPGMPLKPLQPFQYKQIQQFQQMQKPLMNNQNIDPNLLRKSLPQMSMQYQQPYMMQQMYNQDYMKYMRYDTMNQNMRHMGNQQMPIHMQAKKKEERLDKYLVGGIKNRLLLALESELPNEIDWALNILLKISFQFQDNNFCLDSIPELTEVLAQRANDFLDNIELLIENEKDYENSNDMDIEFEDKTEDMTQTEFNDDDDPSLINDLSLDELTPEIFDFETPGEKKMKELTIYNTCFLTTDELEQELERTRYCIDIIRNFSFTEINARYFASKDCIIEIIKKSFKIPTSSPFFRIKKDMLDIFENISFYLIMKKKYLSINTSLKKMLFEDDRTLVIGAIRSLTRMCYIDCNVHFLTLETPIVQQLLRLLLVWDEELVTVIMDLLYQYTGTSHDMAVHIATSSKTNIVRLLMKFLSWKGIKNSSPQAPSVPNSPISLGMPQFVKRNINTNANNNNSMNQGQSHHPSSSLNPSSNLNFNNQQNPNNTMDTQQHINNWLVNSYEYNKDSFYPRTEFILDYQKHCRRPNDPPFPPQEVFNQINILFPSIVIVNTGSSEQPNIELKGLKAKETKNTINTDNNMEVDKSIELSYYCRWDNCKVTKATEEEIFKHILQEHLKDQTQMRCQWKNCTKFHDKPVESITLLASHLKIHFPLKKHDKPTPPTPPEQQQQQQQPTPINTNIINPQSQQQQQQPYQPSPYQQQSQPHNPYYQQNYPMNNPYNSQPLNPSPLVPPSYPYQQPITPTQQQNLINKASLDDNFEITGIPLTTALILRNLARPIENHILFTPYETNLAALMNIPKLSKPIATIVAELRT